MEGGLDSPYALVSGDNREGEGGGHSHKVGIGANNSEGQDRRKDSSSLEGRIKGFLVFVNNHGFFLFNFLFFFNSIEHRGIWVGPQEFFIVGNDGSSNNRIFKIEIPFRFLINHVQEEFGNIVTVKTGRGSGHLRWKISFSDDCHSIVFNDLIFNSAFTISTIFSSKINNDTTRSHGFDHFFGDEHGGFSTRN